MALELPGFDQIRAGDWLCVAEAARQAGQESPPAEHCQAVTTWLDGLIWRADEGDRYLCFLAGVMFEIGMLNHLPLGANARYVVQQLALDLQQHIDLPAAASESYCFTWEQFKRFFSRTASEAHRIALSLSLKAPH